MSSIISSHFMQNVHIVLDILRHLGLLCQIVLQAPTNVCTVSKRLAVIRKKEMELPFTDAIVK